MKTTKILLTLAAVALSVVAAAKELTVTVRNVRSADGSILTMLRIDVYKRQGMNRLLTTIDFIDINMPEIYLIYISYRTIFATATRKNNTNI